MYQITHALASSLLPTRNPESNKGSFGRAALIVGSEKYPGAAMLALEAALRGGAGYVNYIGTAELCRRLQLRSPEALYTELDYTVSADRAEITSILSRATSILVGCGCVRSESLLRLVAELLATDGASVVLDADAINSIAKYGTTEIIRNSRRRVILTPHPLEFSRLSGLSVDEIQADRQGVSREFARENGCILLLKGAGTVITDGNDVYVNTSGSTALAKAGSGDVLAGLLSSLLAFSESPVKTAALAAYVHGKAADNLAISLSEFGVTPSDLPIECAKVLATLGG